MKNTGDTSLFYITLALWVLPLMVFTLDSGLPEHVQSWNITEWLISYPGEFVRRGLPGEIIQTLSKSSSLNPVFIAIATSLLLLLVTAFLYFRIASEFIPKYILLSPIFFGAAVYGEEVIRKDILLVLLFFAALSTLSASNGLKSITAANAISVVAILSHEIFLFVSIPPLIWFHFLITNKITLIWGRALHSVIAFTPAIAVGCLAIFIFEGNASIATGILQEWNEIFAVNYPKYCCFDDNPAAIGAIGWTTSEGLALSRSALNDFSLFIWVPLAWILSILFCFFLILHSINKDELRLRKIFCISYIFVFICTLPLFVVGWDFGRWIFLINTNSFLLCVYIYKNCNHFSDNYFVKSWIYRDREISNRLKLFVAFGFSIPSCCWSINAFAAHSLIGALLRSLKTALN